MHREQNARSKSKKIFFLLTKGTEKNLDAPSQQNEGNTVVVPIQIAVLPQITAAAKGIQCGRVEDRKLLSRNQSGDFTPGLKSGQIVSGLDPDAASGAGGAIPVNQLQSRKTQAPAAVQLKGQLTDGLVRPWHAALEVDFTQVITQDFAPPPGQDALPPGRRGLTAR